MITDPHIRLAVSALFVLAAFLSVVPDVRRIEGAVSAAASLSMLHMSWSLASAPVLFVQLAFFAVVFVWRLNVAIGNAYNRSPSTTRDMLNLGGKWSHVVMAGSMVWMIFLMVYTPSPSSHSHEIELSNPAVSTPPWSARSEHTGSQGIRPPAVDWQSAFSLMTVFLTLVALVVCAVRLVAAFHRMDAIERVGRVRSSEGMALNTPRAGRLVPGRVSVVGETAMAAGMALMVVQLVGTIQA